MHGIRASKAKAKRPECVLSPCGVVHVRKGIKLSPHVIHNAIPFRFRELAGAGLPEIRAEHLRHSKRRVRHQWVPIHSRAHALAALLPNVPLHPGAGVEIVDRRSEQLSTTIANEKLERGNTRRFDGIYVPKRPVRWWHPQRLRCLFRTVALFFGLPLQKGTNPLFE
jgi:hypothetical protein